MISCLRDAGVENVANLAVPCRQGMLAVGVADTGSGLPGGLQFRPEAVAADLNDFLALIRAEVARRGSILPWL